MAISSEPIITILPTHWFPGVDSRFLFSHMGGLFCRWFPGIVLHFFLALPLIGTLDLLFSFSPELFTTATIVVIKTFVFLVM